MSIANLLDVVYICITRLKKHESESLELQISSVSSDVFKCICVGHLLIEIQNRRWYFFVVAFVADRMSSLRSMIIGVTNVTNRQNQKKRFGWILLVINFLFGTVLKNDMEAICMKCLAEWPCKVGNLQSILLNLHTR